MRGLFRIVAPFRPFPPESALHRDLDAFDWETAIRMLALSATRACRCPVSVITDHDYEAPIQAFHYATTQRRLMLWTLEVIIHYLKSRDCNRNTICVDCDQLIYRDIRPWLKPGIDLAVLIRPDDKHQTEHGQPLLNGVQWWAKPARRRLVAFYRQALDLAHTLPDHRIVWGADTDAVRMLLEPLEVGVHERSGLVVEMINAADVLEALSEPDIDRLEQGLMPRPPRGAVIDFRWTRKRYMQAYYNATLLREAVA